MKNGRAGGTFFRSRLEPAPKPEGAETEDNVEPGYVCPAKDTRVLTIEIFEVTTDFGT